MRGRGRWQALGGLRELLCKPCQREKQAQMIESLVCLLKHFGFSLEREMKNLGRNVYNGVIRFVF